MPPEPDCLYLISCSMIYWLYVSLISFLICKVGILIILASVGKYSWGEKSVNSENLSPKVEEKEYSFIIG